MPREISTHWWVFALLRRASLGGAFATVAHKGDDERGDVLVKVVPAHGEARLFAPAVSVSGPAEFEELASGPETTVDSVVKQRLRADRDLWVIEIEDRAGRHFLTERVRTNRS